MAGSAVWLDVLPAMGKLAPGMTKGAVSAAATAGKAAGASYSAAMAAGAKGGGGATALVAELEVAAKKAARVVQAEKTAIYNARTQEKAAAQQVAAAETRLAEVRAKNGAESSAAMRADAALTTARGKSQVASMKTVAVEDQLRAAFTEQKVITTQLGTAQGSALKQANLMNGGLARTAALGSPVAAGLGKIGGGVSSLAGAAMGTLAPLAGMAAGFAGLLGIGKVISLGNQYTATMNELQAVTGLSDDAMKGVAATARSLGSDLTLPATSGADAAAIMVELAKGGLSAAASMDAAKGTIQLAAAAQIEGARAAEIQATALNQFRLGADQASMVADVLANTANAAAGGVDDIATSLKYVGPVASSLSMDIGSTAAAIGLLANNGLKGDTAGTALRGMLASLAAPSKEAQKGIDALGITAFDSEGKFVGMRTVIDQLAQAQKSMTQEQFANNSAMAFGREPLSAVTALATSGADAYDQMTLAVTKQGGAAEVANSKMKGFGGALDKLGSQLEDVALSIYDTVAPALTAGATMIAGSLDGAGSKVQSFLKTAGALGKLVIGGDYTGDLGAGLGLTEDSVPVDLILTARDKVIAGFGDIKTFVTTQLIPSIKNIAVAIAPVAAVVGGAFVLAWQILGSLLVNVVGPALVTVTRFLSENQGIVLAFAAVLGVLTAAFYAQKASMAVQGAGGLLAYVKGIGLVRGATALWAAGQWALNAALLANPVGLVILAVVAIVAAIAALVAGLVWAYNNVGWFRDGVNAAMDGIMIAVRAVGDAGVWLWENALKPAWDAIAGAATWLYQTILKPAFDGIALAVQFVGLAVQTYIGFWVGIFQTVAAAATWLWQTILAPAFAGIAAVVTWVGGFFFAVFDLVAHIITYVVGAAVTWLYETVFRPTFALIGALVDVWWNQVVMPVFTAVVGFVRDTLGAIFTWLWESVISPVFTWISDRFALFKLGAEIIFSAVGAFVQTKLAPIFTWLYETIIKPAFDGISSTIAWVWNNGIKPIFDALSGFVQDTLPKAFETGRDAIGRAWDGLKALAKEPIKFVVDTIINDGLIKNFNKVADFFGSKKIDEIKLPAGFAGGGVIPGYQSQKRDDVLTPMRRGEGVLVPEVVRGLGASFVHRLNAAGNSGGASAVRAIAGQGYAEGGIVGNAIDWVRDTAGAAGRFISDPVGSLGSVVDGLVARIPGAAGMVDVAKGAVTSLVAQAVEAIRGIGEKAMTVSGATGENGRLPAAMLAPVPSFSGGPGVGSMGGYLRRDAAAALAAAESVRGSAITVTEGYRDLAGQQMRWNAYKSGRGNLAATPGTSNHGYGISADINGSGQSWLAKNGPTFGWYPTGLGFSQREPWHFDYKGKASPAGMGMYEGGVVGQTPTLYDDGGLLNRGVSLIRNESQKPEYALPEDRLIGIVREASGDDQAPLIGGDFIMQSSGDTGEDLADATFELRRLLRGGRK